MRRAFVKLLRLNTLGFAHQRLETEVGLDSLKTAAYQEMKGYCREAPRKGDAGELVDDLCRQMERTWQFAQSQLTLIRENYRQTLDYRHQRVLVALAWVTAFLAAVAVVLMVLQFVPQSTRMDVVSWLRQLLSGCKGWLCSLIRR